MQILCPFCDVPQPTLCIRDAIIGTMDCVECGKEMILDPYERDYALTPFLDRLAEVIPDLQLEVQLQEDLDDEPAAPEKPANGAIKKAAATGDLTAALNNRSK
ncbi:hypothetical protein GFL39_26070 [Rhizobium leguminosarum bv. viciae]|uniref:hypothetical protein n=1 Tax=Rhizobium leguminosarum TaxID=384 RepID=UPI0014412C63|nr:hypothetical protein [Rhizobium leguminosarum]NKL08340.1 hypothetical protein [Rhizobium leguminosarum bv. viciae]